MLSINMSGIIWMIKYVDLDVCLDIYTNMYTYTRGFPGGPAVKNLPAMQEMQI